MLTTVGPFLVYLLSFPIMIVSIFRIEIGLLFFITITPIISVQKKIVEFPGGHNFGDFIIISLILGWLYSAHKENRELFRSTPINTVVFLMIFGAVVNLMWSYQYMPFSWSTSLETLMAWKNYMILPVIYFLYANNIYNEDRIKRIIFCICIAMLAMDFNFYSTFRWIRAYHFSNSIRISGAFVSLGPNELGAFYCIFTFLLLSIAYYIENKKLKMFVLCTCACNFYPIIYSYSRAAYMSALSGFVVLGLLKDKKILILIMVLILSYKFVLPISVVERIDMTFLEDNNISQDKEAASIISLGGTSVDTVGRKELWDNAIKYFIENPLLGIGFDNFRRSVGMITHNMYMKILAEQGLIGMLIFLIFIWTLLKQSYKLFKNATGGIRKGIGLGFFTCTIVHLVGSGSGDQSIYYQLMAIYWMFAGIVAFLNTENEKV